MRISIEHRVVRSGWLFKLTYHAVDCTVHFTHEERQIIRQHRLGSTALLTRRPATAKVDDRDEQFTLSVNHLLAGTDRFLSANPSAAKGYQAELLAALEQLKAWLQDNAESATRAVVEL